MNVLVVRSLLKSQLFDGMSTALLESDTVRKLSHWRYGRNCFTSVGKMLSESGPTNQFATVLQEEDILYTF